jgi:hypothetical protein
MYNKNAERLYHNPIFKLWVPHMLEAETFKKQKIRYLASTIETMYFAAEHRRKNIPDYSIEDFAENIYQSLRKVGVGDKPTIFVCHSMGGLIGKKVILKFHENGISQNIKGVAFYSTPHYGSQIITTIFNLLAIKLIEMKNIFETNCSEHGMTREDIRDQYISRYEFSKATSEICLNGKSNFEKEHIEFKKLGINYINFHETEKTDIYQRNMVHIVEPESRYLPETHNYYLDNTSHSTLQKFSPNNFEDKGYDILVNFIRDMLKL